MYISRFIIIRLCNSISIIVACFRMQDAEACFLIAARNYTDRNAAVSIFKRTRTSRIMNVISHN